MLKEITDLKKNNSSIIDALVVKMTDTLLESLSSRFKHLFVMQRTFTEVQSENDKQIVRLARELQELEKFLDKKIGTMLPLVNFNLEKAGFARVEEIRNIEHKISNLAQADEVKQELKSLKSGIEKIKV